MTKTYNLNFCQNIFIFDKGENFLKENGVRFHIDSDDYFGTLATVLDLIRQEKKQSEEKYLGTLDKLKKDLVYLQKNYRIIKKKKTAL